MLVPYTPVSQLTDEEKKLAQAQLTKGKKIVEVNGKVVSVNELQGQVPPPVRQNLFE